jgi:hypothetical protein
MDAMLCERATGMRGEAEFGFDMDIELRYCSHVVRRVFVL